MNNINFSAGNPRKYVYYGLIAACMLVLSIGFYHLQIRQEYPLNNLGGTWGEGSSSRCASAPGWLDPWGEGLAGWLAMRGRACGGCRGMAGWLACRVTRTWFRGGLDL